MGKISIVSMNNEDIFNFPCDYPIKIFGLSQPEFKKTVCNIIESHIGKLHTNQITIKNVYEIFQTSILQDGIVDRLSSTEKTWIHLTKLRNLEK